MAKGSGAAFDIRQKQWVAAGFQQVMTDFFFLLFRQVVLQSFTDQAVDGGFSLAFGQLADFIHHRDRQGECDVFDVGGRHEQPP